MKRLYRDILWFCLPAIIPALATAETVTIPVGQQGSEFRSMETPRRGMMKADVESGFGAPVVKSRAVGEPPISYWEFDHYYVYFENDRVLHTVFKHTNSGS